MIRDSHGWSLFLGAVVGVLVILFGIEPVQGADAPSDAVTTSEKLPRGVAALTASGIHNLFAVGTNVFSGSSPEGREGFEALAKLGVRTIITVDGATPDVELARELGMRYVHLPHGYDGIDGETQLMLARAGRELEGPFYVHCHHGKHRGPAAVAIICMADQGWSREQAEAFLVAAGTSTNYVGLYETVREFEMPSQAALDSVPNEFPETARVSGLVDAMVAVDERWENLLEVRAAGYVVPPDHPDIVPANEVVILWEHYREAQRLPETAEYGEDMIEQFRESERVAREAERLLREFVGNPRPELKIRLDQAFDAMKESCSKCHQEFRN